MRILLYLMPIVLAIFCLVEAISARDDEVRHLSRAWWILLILFFPFIGSIAWLAAGRPVRAPRRPGPYERSASAFPEYDRPGRFAATDPAADDAFLAQVRERAEEQRRLARERKEAEELKAAEERAAREAREAQESSEGEPEPDQPTA